MMRPGVPTVVSCKHDKKYTLELFSECTGVRQGLISMQHTWPWIYRVKSSIKLYMDVLAQHLNWRLPWKRRLMCTEANLRKTCLKFSSWNNLYLA